MQAGPRRWHSWAMDVTDDFTAPHQYLNTASMGLPPRTTQQALRTSHQDWAHGDAQASDYDVAVARSRELYAELVHVDIRQVTIGHQVAPVVGLLAAAVPDGATVLVSTDAFTSLTFPFAAHADRGVQVIEVPLDELAEHIDADTYLVAVESVQSATGRLADLDAIEAACTRHGAELIVDTTQSAGWLDLDASRFAATVCGGYKWLLSPRGTAFLTLRPDLIDRLRPLAANWFAGAQVWDSIYRMPLRLATDARRFDVSPAWHSWVGTEASLTYLAGLGVPAVHDHAVAVARAFTDAADLPPGDSAIVSLRTDEQTGTIMAQHEVRAAERDGRLRLSFYLYNTSERAAELGAALAGHVRN